MYDQMGSLLKSFDEMFNDDFLTDAKDEEIELRFKFMQDLCQTHKIDFKHLVDELEFSCNSFIAKVAEKGKPACPPGSGVGDNVTVAALHQPQQYPAQQ